MIIYYLNCCHFLYLKYVKYKINRENHGTQDVLNKINRKIKLLKRVLSGDIKKIITPVCCVKHRDSENLDDAA